MLLKKIKKLIVIVADKIRTCEAEAMRYLNIFKSHTLTTPSRQLSHESNASNDPDFINNN